MTSPFGRGDKLGGHETETKWWMFLNNVYWKEGELEGELEPFLGIDGLWERDKKDQ